MFTSLIAAVALQATPTLEEEVAAVDSALFWNAFEGCNPAALGELLADDFRMVHDLGGLAVPSRDAFISSMEEQCAQRETTGYKNRRLLTPGSRRVQPLGEWGALEEGHHQFYEHHDGAWVMTGGARYIHIWQRTEDGLKLSESISINHGAAPEYPPAAGEE